MPRSQVDSGVYSPSFPLGEAHPWRMLRLPLRMSVCDCVCVKNMKKDGRANNNPPATHTYTIPPYTFLPPTHPPSKRPHPPSPPTNHPHPRPTSSYASHSSLSPFPNIHSFSRVRINKATQSQTVFDRFVFTVAMIGPLPPLFPESRYQPLTARVPPSPVTQSQADPSSSANA